MEELLCELTEQTVTWLLQQDNRLMDVNISSQITIKTFEHLVAKEQLNISETSQQKFMETSSVTLLHRGNLL